MIGVGENNHIVLNVQRDGDLFLFDQMFEISQQLVDEGFEPHGFGDSWARVGIGEQVIDNRVEPADFPVYEGTGDDDRLFWWRYPTGTKAIETVEDQQRIIRRRFGSGNA